MLGMIDAFQRVGEQGGGLTGPDELSAGVLGALVPR
jgi:hypothetical protein